jgi:hypothetical protein
MLTKTSNTRLIIIRHDCNCDSFFISFLKHKAITKMNIRPDQTVVIGDQMLTDVFGGNRRGLYRCLDAD